MTRPHITSTANERIKAVRRLTRRRRRAHRDAFVVEGYRQVRRALESDAVVRELYYAPGLFLGQDDRRLADLAAHHGARVAEVGSAAFRSLSGQTRPDGLLAVVERWPTSLASLTLGRSPLLVVADRIERPGNLGTIVRTACSAGAAGLIVSDAPTDVFHPDAVRGSVGTLFSIPIAETTALRAAAWLRERDVSVVVATPDAAAAYWAASYRGRVAVVVGSERHGVSSTWREAAEATVGIPMSATADSVNVAVATGVVLFEAARQRLEASPSGTSL